MKNKECGNDHSIMTGGDYCTWCYMWNCQDCEQDFEDFDSFNDHFDAHDKCGNIK